MQSQPRHKLIATPLGIFLDDKPLHKSAIDTLSARSISHLARANELLGKMTAKDWESPAPHGPDDIPVRAYVEMHLALANPGSLNKYSPDQPRDDKGRWTAVGDTGQNGLERDRLVDNDKGLRIASNDIVVPVPFGVPIIPSRKHPRETGSDDLDEALGISSHSRRSLWPSSPTQNEEEAKSEAQYDRDIDEERRKYDERKKHCLAYCQYELDMPERKDNFGPHRACMRSCMNAGGFENF